MSLEHINENNSRFMGKLSTLTQNKAADRTSDRYSFIPTERLINAFANRGWAIRSAKEANSRKAELAGFQRHMITFRNPDLGIVGDKDSVYPEIVMTNSHDGFASFRLMAGLFRLVCTNGLVVADAMFSSICIRHQGFAESSVDEAINHIIRFVPEVSSRIAEWQNIQLDRQEQLVLAHAAVQYKYDHDPKNGSRVDLERLIRPVRRNDEGGTLWTTYNTIQEKLVKGARILRDEKPSRWSTQFHSKARGVNGISESVKLNKALWSLADGMAKIKNGEANAIPVPQIG